MPVGNQLERTFFTGNFSEKKGIPSSFLVFTGAIGKSLSHSLRPTSTILYDKIHVYASHVCCCKLKNPGFAEKESTLCKANTLAPLNFVY